MLRWQQKGRENVPPSRVNPAKLGHITQLSINVPFSSTQMQGPCLQPSINVPFSSTRNPDPSTPNYRINSMNRLHEADEVGIPGAGRSSKSSGLLCPCGHPVQIVVSRSDGLRRHSTCATVSAVHLLGGEFTVSVVINCGFIGGTSF